MSIWAQLAAVAADAGLAGLAHSELAYASPAEQAAQRKKAGSCTPCAAGARLERAQAHVARATGTGPAPQPRRPRKVAT